MVTKVSSTVSVAMIWLAVVAGVSATAWFAIDRAGRDIAGGSTGQNPASVGAAITTRTPQSSPATGGATTTTPAPTPAATGSPTPTDRSISVDGGQVSLRCTGPTILLRSAQPDDGWRVEVESPGPRQVEAKFESGADESERETRVDAVCVNGAPEINVESHG